VVRSDCANTFKCRDCLHINDLARWTPGGLAISLHVRRQRPRLSISAFSVQSLSNRCPISVRAQDRGKTDAQGRELQERRGEIRDLARRRLATRISRKTVPTSPKNVKRKLAKAPKKKASGASIGKQRKRGRTRLVRQGLRSSDTTTWVPSRYAFAEMAVWRCANPCVPVRRVDPSGIGRSSKFIMP
jgi:hypothetical protein